MSYGLGFKVLQRLCLEQSPLAWQKAKLQADLFKAHEQPCFSWVELHLKQHHQLPNVETLKNLFPEAVQVEVVEPASYYVKQLENAFFLKTINDANISSQEILKNNQDDYELAASRLKKALNTITQQKFRMKIMDVGTEGYDAIINAYNSHGLIENEAIFGWPYMDSQSGGALPGEMVSFVGRPAMGKTWLVVYTAMKNWMVKKKNTLLVSMEMKPLPIVQRVGAIYTETNIGQLKLAGFSKSTYDKFVVSLKGFKGEQAKFYVVDGNLAANVDDIYSLADQLNCTNILIDGGYLIRNSNPKLDRFTRVAENAESIKKNTTELDAATFVSWQLKRDTSSKKNSKETSIDDIGYSDAIGQISSIVLGLFQEEGVETILKRDIRVLKGRNGETGQFSINWDFIGMDFDQCFPVIGGKSKPEHELEYI